MGTYRGLILHTSNCLAAGSFCAIGKSVLITSSSCRPDVASSAFSTMLGLLETLRNQVVSGHEPAPFLITVLPGGQLVMTAGVYAAPWSSLATAFRVTARATADGYWLDVSDATGRAGYRLEQFCRKLPGGRWEALPYCWSRCTASRAYQRTSGFTP